MRSPTILKALLLAGSLMAHLAPRAQTARALQVNLPPQIHLCGTSDSTRLSAVVSGGQTPYRYAWSMAPVSYFSFTFHASDYLDDTTRVQPLLETPLVDSVRLHLRVRDSLGAEARDSMLVTHSQLMTHLGQLSFSITSDDTLRLPEPNVSSSYPLDSVEWSPARGLVNRHARRPLATPDSNVNYRARIWDSQACSWEGGAFVFVDVSPVGMAAFQQQDFAAYPTRLRPGQILQVELPSPRAYLLKLRDSRGAEVGAWAGSGPEAALRMPQLPADLYFLCYQGPSHRASAYQKIRLW